MSLQAYYGDAGSGKGYTLMQVIIAAVKQGVPVVTTLDLLPIFFEDFPDAKITFCKTKTKEVKPEGDLIVETRLVNFSEPVYGAVYVLDELHEVIDSKSNLMCFASGLAQNRVPKHVIDFISKRRQFHNTDTGRGIQIVVDTQNPILLAPWIKAHIELAIYCEKHLEVNTTNFFKRFSYSAPSCKKDFRSKSDLVSTELMLPYFESVYKYYKSHGYAVSEVKIVDEKRLTKGASLFKTWYFWLTLFGLYFLITGSIDAYQEFSDPSSFSVKPIKPVKPDVPVPVSLPVPAAHFVTPPPVTQQPFPVGVPVYGRDGSHMLVDRYIGGVCSGYVVKSGKTYRFCKSTEIYYLEVSI